MNGRTRAAVLSVGALLVAACGGGGGVSVVTTEMSTPPGSTAPGSDVTESTSVINTGESTTPSIEPDLIDELVIVDTGFSAETSDTGRTEVSAGAEVSNPTDFYVEYLSYDVRFLDAGGVELETSMGTEFAIPPGGTGVLTGWQLFREGEAVPTDVEFIISDAGFSDGSAALAGSDDPIDLRKVSVVVGETRYSADYNEEHRFIGTLANQGTERVTRLTISCLFLSSGAIVGGSTALVTEVLPGETAGFIARPRVSEGAPPDATRCVAAPSYDSVLTAATDRGLDVVTSGLSTASRNYAGGFDISAGAIVRNSSELVATDVRYQVDVLDADGLVLEVVDDDGYVMPGEEASVAPVIVMSQHDPVAASVRLRFSVGRFEDPTAATGVVGSEPFDLTIGSAFGTDNRRWEVEYGNGYTTVDVTNSGPIAVLGGLELSCTLLAGGQATGGGSWSSVGEIPVGGRTEVQIISVFRGTPVHDDIWCTVHINSLFETASG